MKYFLMSILLFFTLSSCGKTTQKSATPTTSKKTQKSNAINKLNTLKASTPRNNLRPLTAEDIEIQNILDKAQITRQNELISRKTSATFHYKIALKTFNGSLDYNSHNRISDLNVVRNHLLEAINYDPQHSKSWALLTKVESYLGVPHSKNQSILIRASQARHTEKKQKNMEFKQKLLEAEKLIEKTEYTKAIRILEQLQRQID